MLYCMNSECIALKDLFYVVLFILVEKTVLEKRVNVVIQCFILMRWIIGLVLVLGRIEGNLYIIYITIVLIAGSFTVFLV